MRTLSKESKLTGMLIALAVLISSANHLRAQTPVNQKQASPTDAVSKNAATITPAAVGGVGVAGQVPLWLDSDSLGSSIISQSSGKIGRIGIGTTSPTSKLTVNGIVESLSGGFKFPDGSTQITALGVPLILAGAPSNSPIINATNTGSGALATGVFGQSTSGNGLHGLSVSGFGVAGYSQSNNGVSGSSDGSGVVSGVSGLNFNTGPGVRGWGIGGGPGVLGQGGAGPAGKFEGNVNIVPSAGGQAGDLSVAGNLSKASGSFKIDHPLDPGNKYLYHSFVESPDMMNIYNGNVKLDANGEATVELPEWFGTLNRDFRYSLTALGAAGPNLYVAEEVADNHFKIAGGTPGAKVSWTVTGIRQDAWANAHRIIVEEQKTERERGHYLHPELYGQPEEKSVEWARHPEFMKQVKQEREKRDQ